MRDFQKSKLYAWERGYTHAPKEPHPDLADCARMIADLLRLHGQIPLRGRRMHVKPGQGASWARGCYNIITLPAWARTTWVIAHETTHAIAADGHGPRFCRTYAELLVMAGAKATTPEIVKDMKAFGLKVAPSTKSLKKPRIPKAKIRVSVQKTWGHNNGMTGYEVLMGHL